MVKIGDKIKTEYGLIGTVTDIAKFNDNRYIVFYKCKDRPHFFIEGDEDYRVIKWER